MFLHSVVDIARMQIDARKIFDEGLKRKSGNVIYLPAQNLRHKPILITVLQRVTVG